MLSVPLAPACLTWWNVNMTESTRKSCDSKIGQKQKKEGVKNSLPCDFHEKEKKRESMDKERLMQDHNESVYSKETHI